MNYYELVTTVLLKKELSYLSSYETLSNFINKAMLKDNLLKEIHTNKKPTLYCFSSLYPVEKSKVYQKGRVYIFRLRSIDKKFISHLMATLKQTESETFNIINSELKTKSQRPIEELVLITPLILTTEEGYKLPETNQLLYVENRIKDILEKKYKQYYGENITADPFLLSVEKTNHKPIKIPYKNINFLGNKFKLTVDSSDNAQKLATFGLACGVGEKVSIGASFANANFVRR
ncbi:CRISPR-associated endoribonuclease Cas6 [Natranaerovirga hydrolytica]|uniref:CRISPR-associated endoribonuclease Cas6 n=1 Tax=Natranaerovirga hydrolytica TaxID=680378 RepID=A0A4R1MZA8_9FIRM|nr:CRISPR-associated endoribonuclease Cas6 [Natranaerovirga hydrolytica]TCK98668.1 CRISPR-associated endoribonuclease Cas6 [Natranaerovirga hydrolytica]